MLLKLFFLLLVIWANSDDDVLGLKNLRPSCMDEQGKPIDWFIAYKFPMVKQFKSGHNYAYMTSETVRKSMEGATRLDQNKGKDFDWVISRKLLNDSESLVMRSLALVYEQSTDVNLNGINNIFYNDSPPKDEDGDTVVNTNSRRAHAKGAIVIEQSKGDGVWMSHSVPRFPPPREYKLEFEPNFKVFGQTFMCINFNVDEAGKQIFDHLINMRPLVYDSHISDVLMKKIPELSSLTLGKRMKYDYDNVHEVAQTINTKAGQPLQIYSKSSNFGEDMYAGWMDFQLNSTLLVQTWRNGAGIPLNSSCPRHSYHVENVKDLRVKEGSRTVYWNYQRDHSKWAISEEEKSGYVCISDVNRMESQFKRGGGAICIHCPSCWVVFNRTISDIEPCAYEKPAIRKSKSMKRSLKKKNTSKSKSRL